MLRWEKASAKDIEKVQGSVQGSGLLRARKKEKKKVGGWSFQSNTK